MEIPKNTTQIGEIHGDYKVFIEDYVISYMKQLCRQEPDRKKRIAFYGVMRTEEAQQYFFIYGGSEVTRYGKNDSYLMKQDYEEIARAGEKYFEDYVSLGFVTIEDELPEGIYLVHTGKEIYVQGYHIFYEKNESMLTFLIHRQNEKTNEKKDENIKENYNEKAEEKDFSLEPGKSEARQILRQKQQEEIPQGEVKLFGIVKSAAAALFIVLCVTAISTMNGLGKMEGVQNYFQKAFQAMSEKKIPDREEVMPTSVDNTPEQASVSENIAIVENITEEAMEEEIVEEKLTEEIVEEEPITEQIVAEEPVVAETEPQTHTIQEGETLISISKTYYGDDSRVQTICELNGITNSDNIQVGQKIILP